MTDKQFTRIMTALVADIRDDTPKKTRNLRKHATSGRSMAHGKFVISVSGRIAPYFEYVNYYPNHRHRNKDGIVVDGSINRNYQYFEKSLEKHLEKYAKAAGGVVEHG